MQNLVPEQVDETVEADGFKWYRLDKTGIWCLDIVNGSYEEPKYMAACGESMEAGGWIGNLMWGTDPDQNADIPVHTNRDALMAEVARRIKLMEAL